MDAMRECRNASGQGRIEGNPGILELDASYWAPTLVAAFTMLRKRT